MRQTFDAIKLNPTKLIMEFGPPKTGKTRALATLVTRCKPPSLPIYYFDFDGGDAIEPMLRAIEKSGVKLAPTDIIRFSYVPKGGDKVAPNEVRPRGQGRDIFMDFLNDFNALHDYKLAADGSATLVDGTPFPKLIVFDSITALQDIILDFILCCVGHDLGAKGTDSRSDYGKQMGKTVEILKSACTLPCKTVIIAHEKLDRNDTTGEIRIDPSFTGQLAATVGREFGTVLYSKTKKVGSELKYVWQTAPDGFVKSVGVRNREGLAVEIDQDFSLVL